MSLEQYIISVFHSHGVYSRAVRENFLLKNLKLPLKFVSDN